MAIPSGAPHYSPAGHVLQNAQWAGCHSAISISNPQARLPQILHPPLQNRYPCPLLLPLHSKNLEPSPPRDNAGSITRCLQGTSDPLKTTNRAFIIALSTTLHTSLLPCLAKFSPCTLLYSHIHARASAPPCQNLQYVEVGHYRTNKQTLF